MRGIQLYKRQDLYDAVWSAPLRDAAKRFGVSDVALKKICVRLQVPTPKRGYWLRPALKRAAAKQPLPPHSRGLDEISLRGWFNERVEPSAAARIRAEAERQETEQISVGATLIEPHPLVAKSAKLLARAKTFDGLVSSRDRGLDIAVAPANVPRALCIIDSLLKGLVARSLRVEVTAPTQKTEWGRLIEVGPITRVQVDDEWIRFSLSERVNIAPPPFEPTPKRSRTTLEERLYAPRRGIQERRLRTPTGNLSLTISYGSEHRHWRDRKHRTLESFLNDFIAHLFVAADWIKQKRAADEEEQRAKDEAARLRAEAEQRAAIERERIEGLDEMLEKWRRVRDIRELASQIRGLVHASSMRITQGGPLHEQVAWMLAYADKIDPLRELRAGLMTRTSEGERRLTDRA